MSTPAPSIRYTKDTCPDRAKHTRCPSGYLAWHEWSARKYRTHYQVQCPTCGLWAIYRKREKPLTKAQVEADLYPNPEPAQ